MSEQSKLENIFSYSFPANHLMQISIVKQISEQKSYKRGYFCFMTLAPGTQNSVGERSFDFKNRITIKVDGHQVNALAYAIKEYVNNRVDLIGPFSIYVDSSKSSYGQQGQGHKSLSIQRTINQKQNNPAITFFFKVGTSQALAVSMTPAIALAVADVFEFVSKKCLELEFARGPVGSQIGTYQNTEHPPQGDNQKVANNFSEAFDNFTDNNSYPFM